MSDDVQAQAQAPTQVADQHWHLGLPQGIDPRKVLDAAGLERVLKAQAAARAQAAAATTVVIGTIVTLVTSAFGFVAALAWNQAINAVITSYVQVAWKLNKTLLAVLQAIAVTIVAVIAVIIIQRVAGRWAKKSAIGGS